MAMSGTRKKRKSSPKKHRVYCTYFPDGRYYIGYSCKTEKLYEKYYGSSTIVKEYEGELTKETIAEFDKKSHARCKNFFYSGNNEMMISVSMIYSTLDSGEVT